MSIHRRAAKRDANEPEIVRALLNVGASVERLSGKDIPDLLVGFRQTTFLIEVKDEANKGRVKPGQKDFADGWRGGPVGVCWNITDALVFIGAMEPGWRGAD